MKKKKKLDKDFIVLLIISILLSCFIQIVYGNTATIKTQLDYYCFISLSIFPFGLPFGYSLVNKKNKELKQG